MRIIDYVIMTYLYVLFVALVTWEIGWLCYYLSLCTKNLRVFRINWNNLVKRREMVWIHVVPSKKQMRWEWVSVESPVKVNAVDAHQLSSSNVLDVNWRTWREPTYLTWINVFDVCQLNLTCVNWTWRASTELDMSQCTCRESMYLIWI